MWACTRGATKPKSKEVAVFPGRLAPLELSGAGCRPLLRRVAGVGGRRARSDRREGDGSLPLIVRCDQMWSLCGCCPTSDRRRLSRRPWDLWLTGANPSGRRAPEGAPLSNCKGEARGVRGVLSRARVGYVPLTTGCPGRRSVASLRVGVRPARRGSLRAGRSGWRPGKSSGLCPHCARS